MSWLERLPESFGAKHKMKLLTLFDTYLGATCGILRRTMHEPLSYSGWGSFVDIIY